jgi:CubicO group peptidase (beta-lactamase class C family)
MKKKQFNKIQLPTDLSAVTQRDPHEVPADVLNIAQQKIETLWQGVEKLYQTGLYPALALALRKNNQLLLHRVIGHAQGNGPKTGEGAANKVDAARGSGKKLMQLDTPVCLFSASKCMTSTLIYWLDALHEFSLHQPIAYYLPKFKSTSSGKVTAEQLLNHRAGIPSFPEGLDMHALLDREVLIKLLTQLRPEWSDNRTGYHATTAGFMLGLLIEEITQKSLVEVVDEVLRKPMGLKYFNYGLAPDYRDKVALNYPTGDYLELGLDRNLRRMLGGRLEDLIGHANQPEFMDAVVPSANFFATSGEVCEFFQMLLDNGHYQGKTILPEHCLQAMIQAQAKAKFEFDHVLKFPIRYSGGFMLGRDPIGGWGAYSARAFGHVGLTNNLCWVDANKNLSVSLLTTGNPLWGPHILQLMRWVMQVSIYLK